MAESPLYQPLSAQDASFVFFEHRATHMHVALLAIFEVGPLRSATGGVDAARLARYGESHLEKLPRYRQKLAFAPLSGRPVWVDDPHFDLDLARRRARARPLRLADQGAPLHVVRDLGALADDVDAAFHELRGAAGSRARTKRRRARVPRRKR